MNWFGSLWRAIWIGVVVNACLAAYLIGRIGTLFIWDRTRRASAVARLRGRLLRFGMAHLGATFIKLGQVLSTRPDILAPETIDELRLLQDKLPPTLFARLRPQLEAELGGPLADHFREFDEIPVAAASVAQVHRAVTHDGDEVAVKILRPDVRARVERDGRILRFQARILNLIPAIRSTDPIGHLEHFLAGILEQTDLRLEADNYEVFRRNFEGNAQVRFPRVYRGLSEQRVLTMEFLRGRKVDALGPGDHSAPAFALRDLFLKMCFEDGFLHADLHPGNLLIDDSQRIVIFDVGLVVRLNDRHLAQVVDLGKCLSFGQTDDFVSHLRNFHTYVGDIDWPALTRDAEAFASRFRGRTTAELEWGVVIGDMFAIGRRYGLKPVPEMALLLVGLVTAEGIGKMLNPNANSFQDLGLYLMPLLARKGLLPTLPMQST